SAVGVQVVQVLANLAMIAAGAWFLMMLRRRRFAGWRWTPGLAARLAAVLCLAYGAGAEMQLSWSSGSGGEMALSMVATKVLHLDSSQYDAALAHDALVSFGINLAVIGVAALVAACLALPFRRRAQRVRFSDPPAFRAWLVPVRSVLGTGPALGRASAARNASIWLQPSRVALASLAGLALLYGSVQPAVAFDEAHDLPAAAPPRQARLAAMVDSLPSVVTVTPTTTGWAYAVNGHRQVVRGFGYNAVTEADTADQRAALYDRDFQAMSDAGANTIVGWDQQHFDELLMQKAAQHGLGVILPFDLGPGLAYEDPAVRQQLTAAILQRVMRFRNSPALRMWGLGNEVLHEILRAHGTQVRYDGFAQFLVQAADRIHELDPNHPVVYRDAEDWYVAPVIKALADGKSRPWFVYSMNFFTTRMRQALDSGPTRTAMHQPLMISEYGPVGLRPENRPAGYRELWGIIRDHPDTVLGGSAYVWTTAGPEPLERNFGLTNANGQPVDGALAELAALYSSET
ncbi:MAG: glycoside hydrolase family 2 TIM barrel-domain containing protein, partial [Chloroflexota bacterium]